MRWAQLLQALAARGGLKTPDEVQAHLREAAPERDFRQLIELVRTALGNVINAGKPESERRWVDVCAIYADRVIVEHNGRKWQYSYTLADGADGTGQHVQLGAAQEVIEQFVPVKLPPASTVRESVAHTAASFREAADGSIAVTIVRAGPSKNGNYYPDVALREGVASFEGVRVFAKSDDEHIKGQGKSVRNLIGGIYDVRFVEGIQPDTGALTGTFRAIDPDDSAVKKMVEAVKRGLHGLLGLSIDADARIRKRKDGSRTLREAVRFTKVHSVDLIVEPGAGGGLDRLTEAAADPEPEPITQKETAMPLWKKRLLEAIQKKNSAAYAKIDPQTIGDDELVNLHESVCGPLVPTDPASQRLTEAAMGNDAPVTRAEFQMLQLRGLAASRISASNLPAPAKQKLNDQFQRAERFTEAEIEKAIKDEGDYLARFTESGAVRVPGFGQPGSIEVGDRSVQMRDMLDAFFDPAHKDHGSVQSIKEAYIQITGDRRVTGRISNCDVGRMAESLGVMREAVTSTSFGDAMGDTLNRRLQAVYAGETNLDVWKKVAALGTVTDFRTQERVQIGGYGNLPTVLENAAYGALATPGDDKATFAVTKRGGTESVTLEAIKNDDVNAIRRIPVELGLAAKNTLHEFVFDFFRANPVIYDTKSLYHADHNNLFTAALSATEFTAHRLAMLKQTRSGSGKRLGGSPRTILVPFELQETAFNLFVRNQNLDKTFVQTINPEIIAIEHWMDANDWVTVGDVLRNPVLEVSFLDGKQEPELFIQDLPNVGSLFTNDAITYKIRHIYGGVVLVDGWKATTKAVVV